MNNDIITFVSAVDGNYVSYKIFTRKKDSTNLFISKESLRDRETKVGVIIFEDDNYCKIMDENQDWFEGVYLIDKDEKQKPYIILSVEGFLDGNVLFRENCRNGIKSLFK